MPTVHRDVAASLASARLFGGAKCARNFAGDSMCAMSTGEAPELQIFDDPNRDYGDKVVAVEPGGVEFIPLHERHGRPLQMLWTWTSPNMEFATITVGLLGPIAFGMTFWQSVAAIVLGTALGSLSHAVLSSWGPRAGFPQMVLGRSAFGFLGNILPAGVNALVAGIGWFAVNSVSGAYALHRLFTAMPKPLCLVIVVVLQILVAFCGHNLIHVFERYAFPVLTLIFVVASIVVLTKAHPSAAPDYHGGIGGFLVMVGATFGYAAGWNPYASDYTRYLPPETRRVPLALWSALGVFLSCVLLEIAGAAVFTAGKHGIDPGSFATLAPTWLGKLSLLAIALGAVAANALNIYSGSLSFMTIGIQIPISIARAVVALVFGVVGFIVALSALNDPSEYENFLLIISYWIGPWLGVVFVDRILRRRQDSLSLLVDRHYTNWAGPIAMAVAGAIAIWLFANQPPQYVGWLPAHHAALGDLTFEVGFLGAALLYAVLYPVFAGRAESAATGRHEPLMKQ
jgi:NCS1 family nucleobase:cation symporter-1